MLQYLVNVTVIWAVCLLVFELLLKRETWHQWNRTYLLLALAAGLLLPALPFQQWWFRSGGHPASHGIQKLVSLKQAIATAKIAPQPAVTPTRLTADGTAAPGTSGIITGLYLAGLLTGLLLLVRDLVKIAADYKDGIIEKRGRCYMVKCSRKIAPYSFANFIFISRAHGYNDKELDMVLQHEYRHAAMWHSADLFFVSLLQIVCWFHPLVYRYKKRLQLVHEYQADEIGLSNAASYGTFLLEQTLLSANNLSFTHSFHSSLKSRIIMLTKKASAKKRLAKYLVAIPMAAVFMIACTRTDNRLPTAPGKAKAGAIIMRNGHRFEMSPEVIQEGKFTSVGGTDTGTTTFVIPPYPIKMDDEAISRIDYIPMGGDGSGNQQPAFKGGNLGEYLVKASQSLFDRLPDGDYDMHMENLILDKNGRVVFNDRIEVTPGTNMANQEAPYTLLQDINRQTNQAFERSPGFRPGIIKGNPVVSYYFPEEATPANITVKNHHAQFLTEIDPETISRYAVEVK